MSFQGWLKLYYLTHISYVYIKLGFTAKKYNQFQAEGLRTLCLAMRELDEDQWYAWYNRYLDAACSIVDREARLAACFEEIEQVSNFVKHF